MRLQTAMKKFEKAFITFLYVNPVLDIVSGVFIILFEIAANVRFRDVFAVTPSLLIRAFVLLLFGVYLLFVKDPKPLLTVVAIGAAWVLSFIGGFIFAEQFVIREDLVYIVKYGYNLTALFVYAFVWKKSGYSYDQLFKMLRKISSYTLLLLSSSIVISYIIGIGNSTYGNRFGFFGTKGVFNSGNDITAIFMLLLPITLSTFMMMPKADKQKKGTWTYLFYGLAPATSMIALLMIGTKTAYIAILATVAVMLVYAVIQMVKKKDKLLLTRILVVLLMCCLIFGILVLVSSARIVGDIKGGWDMLDISLGEDRPVMEQLTSGRTQKLSKAFDQYKAGGIYAWLFGISRGSQEYVIEMDLFEILFYYGIVGFVVMLWMYLRIGIVYLKKFFAHVKKLNPESLAIFLSLGMCVAYLIIAGHILFSPTSGFYFSFMLLYGVLYYTDKPRNLEIFSPKKLSLKRKKSA